MYSVCIKRNVFCSDMLLCALKGLLYALSVVIKWLELNRSLFLYKTLFKDSKKHSQVV